MDMDEDFYELKIQEALKNISVRQEQALTVDRFNVGGITLQPYKLWHHCVLNRVANAIVKAKLEDADVGQWLELLLLCHKEATMIMKKDTYKRLKSEIMEAHERWKAEGKVSEAFLETLKYLSNALRDSSFSITSKEPSTNTSKLTISNGWTIIHQIAGAYGWTVEYIMNMPMSQINQAMRAIAFDKAMQAGMTYLDYDSEVVDLMRKQQTELNKHLKSK